MTEKECENLLKANWIYEFQLYLVDKCEDLNTRLWLHKQFDEFRKNSDLFFNL